jgi:peptidoglycan/LPS O-acetylase OafA/YrhL
VEPSAAPSLSATPVRIEFVDGLRALAALFVVLHHAWLIIWPVYYKEYPEKGWPESLTTWLSYGHFPVTFFIVISGFCLGLPIARKGAEGWKGAWNFYSRRARRIIPPYYASMVVIGILILTLIGERTGTHWDGNATINWGRVGYAFLMLNNVVPGSSINGVYWSIAVEWQIYLVFPLLVVLWLRFGVWWATLAATLVGYAVAYYTANTPYILLSGQFYAMFALGFLAAYLAHNPTWVKRLSKVPWALVSVLLLAALGFHLRTISLMTAMPWFPIYDIVVGLAALCVLLAGCFGDRRVNGLLCTRPLLQIGAFSYSLYLMHMPILQLAWQYTIRPMWLPEWEQFKLLAIFGVPACLLTAWLFYILIERHFDPAAAKRSRQEHVV